MRVVITGGSGLIGRALTAELAAAGAEVVILSRRPEKVDGLPTGVEVERWDGKTAAGWGHRVAGAAVVHLAGENIAAGRWTDAKKKRIRASRVDSGDAVMQAIEGASEPPRVLLQGSAVGYYGARGDEPVTEATAAGDDFLAGVTTDWEASTDGAERKGVRRVLLRTGVVLSTEGGALPKMLTPFRLGAGGPVGSGDQYMPWIHLADEVGAIRFLLDHPTASGPFNLTAPGPVTNREFARTLGKVLHRPAILPAPAFALRLALGEMADLLLTGQRAVPERLEEMGYSFRFPTLEAALEELLGD